MENVKLDWQQKQPFRALQWAAAQKQQQLTAQGRPAREPSLEPDGWESWLKRPVRKWPIMWGVRFRRSFSICIVFYYILLLFL